MVGNNSKSNPSKEQVAETMTVPNNLNATLKAQMSRLRTHRENENKRPRDPPPQRIRTMIALFAILQTSI